MRKFLMIIIVAGFCRLAMAQSATSAYYEYEPECLGVELDGSQTLRVWGAGRNKNDAVEQAKKNAVRAVIFKGIHGGQT